MDDDNPLRRFILGQDPTKNFPENYKESPIYNKGYEDGFLEGTQAAWREADTVINSVQNILKLHYGTCRLEEE